MDERGAYRVLGLKPGADPRDIKDAYRGLAREWHPDLYPYGPEFRKRCEEKMKRINAAYEILRGRRLPESEEESPEEEWTPEETPEDAADPEPESEPEPEPEVEPDPEPDPREVSAWRRRHDPNSVHGFEWPWRANKEEPDYAGLMRVGAGFAATVIFMTYIYGRGDPHPFYMAALRTVSTITLANGVVWSWHRGYWDVALLLGMLAAVLNPFLPAHMSLFEWQAFAFVFPPTLLWAWLLMNGRESKLR